MAKAQWCGSYDAAQRLVERCLHQDGALFSESGDRSIWTLELAQVLDGRVGAPDESEGNFISKLDRQLSGLEPDAIQLAAELLYVELLGENDTGGGKKEEHVDHVLGLVDGTTAMPQELREALHAGGVASYGSGKMHRDAFMRFLVRLVIEWKSLEPDEQERLLGSPWDFGAFVNGLRGSKDALQSNALLHLIFPETFEYMISPTHRRLLLEAFGGAPGVADVDEEDRQIQIVREVGSAALGRELQLYQKPFHGIWSEPPSPEWQELIPWAVRLLERDDFDKRERDYKLRLAEKVASARTSMEAEEEDWLEQLKAAFKDGENNLTDWRAHDRFLGWCDEDPERASSVVEELWQAESPRSGLAAFLAALPRDAASGPGTRLTLATFLLLGRDPNATPFFKWTVHKDFSALLGRAVQAGVDLDPDAVHRPEELAASLGLDGRRVREFLRESYPREAEEKGTDWLLTAEQAQAVLERFGESEDADTTLVIYASWVSLLEELRLRLLARGVGMRDLLDAQGVAYWLVTAPPEDWSDEEKEAFEHFRHREVGSENGSDEPTVDTVSLPAATSELAAKTHLPQDWLQSEILDLLAEKKQLIFYGPPGTGKTFVAQRLGEHVAGHGGEVRLVQFHPSYTYEDFFEGYRPVGGGDGGVTFDLIPGPLREMAKEAAENPDRPYLLIVDEINRGNVAKVFGELYFLLEYRGDKIELQYSRDERFELPRNLFFVGTMNTADRSIALVDSALRRRFYFVGFVPTRDPVADVLPKWLEANELDPEPAVLLDALNDAINDEDFSIGPSYFMTADGTAPNVERVWEHAIKPLLEEHFYGSGRDLDAEFGPSALRNRLAEAADAAPTETTSGQDASAA